MPSLKTLIIISANVVVVAVVVVVAATVHRRHLSCNSKVLQQAPLRSVKDVLLLKPFECASELRAPVDCRVPIPGPAVTPSSGRAVGKR